MSHFGVIVTRWPVASLHSAYYLEVIHSQTDHSPPQSHSHRRTHQQTEEHERSIWQDNGPRLIACHQCNQTRRDGKAHNCAKCQSKKCPGNANRKWCKSSCFDYGEKACRGRRTCEEAIWDDQRHPDAVARRQLVVSSDMTGQFGNGVSGRNLTNLGQLMGYSR
jgi:hypothetical protein